MNCFPAMFAEWKWYWWHGRKTKWYIDKTCPYRSLEFVEIASSLRFPQIKKAAYPFGYSGPAVVALTMLVRFDKHLTRQLIGWLYIQCICTSRKRGYIKVPVVGALYCIACKCSHYYTITVHYFNDHQSCKRVLCTPMVIGKQKTSQRMLVFRRWHGYMHTIERRYFIDAVIYSSYLSCTR